MRTFIVGDVHGEFKLLNTFIYQQQPKLILQCGELGYWPLWTECDLNKIKNPNTQIIFCKGNHDQLDMLDLLVAEQKIPQLTLVAPNITYAPNSSTYTLPDGRVVLFLGGANSIDKASRRQGIDWFPQEQICSRDIMMLPNGPIDIVISHTCPLEFPVETQIPHYWPDNDWSREALSYVLSVYKPSLWYFGHWHTFMRGHYHNTKWTALNAAAFNNRNWYIELE